MLTNENYFSRENNMKYMGASQFKAFQKCEAMALAEVKGEWVREKTTALLVGSYVDANFEGTLDIFKAHNPEIFTKQGTLKSEYRQAEAIIQRIERDKLFMTYMSGQKQVIMTGEIAGVPFKIKIDSYMPNAHIVDLKIMRDFQPIWDSEQGCKVPFIESWGYDIQGSIYTSVEGNGLPFIIAGATKEAEPDIALFEVPRWRMAEQMEVIIQNAPYYDGIKKGLFEPTRCEKCDYCKSTKVLDRVVDYTELLEV